MRVLSTSTVLIRVFTLLVMAGACTTALAGKVYQWKDAKGVTHFSDSPPPGGQAQDRRIDNRGEPVPGATASKSVENPSCTTARKNLELLADKSPVQIDSDADGKPDKVLTEDDRGAQRNLAEAAVKAYCQPAV
ncbi:MAG: DUF4124 domain-containing protein [Pseudoxanthomonas sp.]